MGPEIGRTRESLAPGARDQESGWGRQANDTFAPARRSRIGRRPRRENAALRSTATAPTRTKRLAPAECAQAMAATATRGPCRLTRLDSMSAPPQPRVSVGLALTSGRPELGGGASGTRGFQKGSRVVHRLARRLWNEYHQPFAPAGEKNSVGQQGTDRTRIEVELGDGAAPNETLTTASAR
jgi:hypothetical protein